MTAQMLSTGAWMPKRFSIRAIVVMPLIWHDFRAS